MSCVIEIRFEGDFVPCDQASRKEWAADDPGSEAVAEYVQGALREVYVGMVVLTAKQYAALLAWPESQSDEMTMSEIHNIYTETEH